jgi:hypothetical protein
MSKVTNKKNWVTHFHSIFYRDNRLAWERLFALAAAFFSFIPKTLLVPAAHGIDPSWAMAVNYVANQQVNFGTDFVFTYGPLGYLLTGYGNWVPVWPIVLYKAFIFLCALLMALRMIRVVDNWTESFLLALLFFIAAQFGMGEGGIVILLILIFLGLETLHKNQWPIWLLMVLLTVVVFFIKINSGFIGFLLLGGCALLAWRQQQLSFWKAALRPLTALLLVIGLAYPLHVSIVPYMVNGMQIISGFQDTMGLDSWYAFTDFYAIVIMLMVIILLFYVLLTAGEKLAADGKISPSLVSECSGLVQSLRYPGVFWALGDSGSASAIAPSWSPLKAAIWLTVMAATSAVSSASMVSVLRARICCVVRATTWAVVRDSSASLLSAAMPHHGQLPQNYRRRETANSLGELASPLV